MQIGKEEYMKWPDKLKRNPKRGKPKKYCKYHRSTGHDTDDCYELKNEIKSLIHYGHLKEYIGDDANASSSQQQQYARPEAHYTLDGVIDVTIGGSTSGEASPSARKAYTKQYNIQSPTLKRPRPKDIISISNDDLQGFLLPHDDALVMSMIITNYMVKRILIDSSSSADILFHDTFEKMQLTQDQL
ncbi:PREDICTED: uncharacterized protein LOC104613139 [Nelumbo nucifera]|uniref:Uncharacterized protein LOC104613139 n=1 Tax=Nelumbo nucifera TaxID=4432 RepID=A0A1U8BPM2_NELNU|nr:PREDICTED: uncharacterized protein LOC104613139 [Nelumbo nucifera]